MRTELYKTRTTSCSRSVKRCWPELNRMISLKVAQSDLRQRSDKRLIATSDGKRQVEPYRRGEVIQRRVLRRRRRGAYVPRMWMTSQAGLSDEKGKVRASGEPGPEPLSAWGTGIPMVWVWVDCWTHQPSPLPNPANLFVIWILNKFPLHSHQPPHSPFPSIVSWTVKKCFHFKPYCNLNVSINADNVKYMLS